jgi:hypothetical protein
MQRVGLGGLECVAEAVPELFGRERAGAVFVRGVLEDGKGGTQRGERQRENALDLSGVDRDRRGAEVLSQQLLGDHAAEGVADQDRRLRQLRDDLRIVLGDLVDAVSGERVGVGPCLLDGRRIAGPTGSRRGIAAAGEQVQSTHGSHELACSHRPWMNRTGFVSSVMVVFLSGR